MEGGVVNWGRGAGLEVTMEVGGAVNGCGMGRGPGWRPAAGKWGGFPSCPEDGSPFEEGAAGIPSPSGP